MICVLFQVHYKQCKFLSVTLVGLEPVILCYTVKKGKCTPGSKVFHVLYSILVIKSISLIWSLPLKTNYIYAVYLCT